MRDRLAGGTAAFARIRSGFGPNEIEGEIQAAPQPSESNMHRARSGPSAECGWKRSGDSQDEPEPVSSTSGLDTEGPLMEAKCGPPQGLGWREP